MTKKSLALLVFLLMALHFLLGEASAQEGEKFGRYQIVINPSMRADTFCWILKAARFGGLRSS